MMEPSRTGRYRYGILLSGILLLSAFLNFWNVWNQGYSNAYYAAAVKSMLANPAVLFFNSFDAAGFITVDKPPVGLWVQAASAALFGFSGWSLVLPQALAGVGSVLLVFLVVSRAFGKPAGLVAALALAVTPIFVAVSRNGTMDAVLIFVLLLAVWVGLKAARNSSFPCLLLAVVLIGIGFNIKMIQAFIVVPAVLSIYFAGAREIPVKRRAAHLLLAVILLLAVSLSWAVAVDSIPADQRPYIGGSGDNTVLGLIINYNGIHRLESDGTGSGGVRGGGMPESAGISTSQNRTADRMTPGDLPQDRASQTREPPAGLAQGALGSGGVPSGMPGMAGSLETVGSPGGGGRNGGMGDGTGSPGITRLFSEGLAGQISWLLPLALIGLLALWRLPKDLTVTGLGDAGLFGERGLTVMGMGLWLLPGLLYFSFTTGFWHTYYIATIAPPLAALVGIGALELYEAYLGDGIRGGLLAVAVVVTGFTQMVFLMYTAEWSGPLPAIIGCGATILAIVLVYLYVGKREGTTLSMKLVAAGAIALLFIAPFVWACTPLMYGSGNILPQAGPQRGGQNGIGTLDGGGMTALPGSVTGGGTSGLAAYLVSHTSNETWIVAEPSSMSAASLIIETGKPVMSLGGFAGSDQVLTLDAMKQMVSDGKVRYFSLGGGMGGGTGSGNSAIFSWVRSTCTAVPSSEWGKSSSTSKGAPADPAFSGSAMNRTSAGMGALTIPGTGGLSGEGDQNSLYDCAGYAG